MEQLHSTTGQLLIVRLVSALIAVSLLGACQMPSPTGSSGQSGPSGASMPSPPAGGGPSGAGMPSPPAGGGPSAPSGTSAPAAGDSSSSDSEEGQQQGSTGNSGGDGQQGEGVEGLDAELDASLEGFDDSMGSGSSSGPDEIDILSPTGSTGVADNSDEPLFEEADSGTVGQSNDAIEQAAQNGPEGQRSASGAGGESVLQGSASNGEEPQIDTVVIPIPDDINDGQGDGIVLRQLRDLAMSEKDPVLRERLWDEYRRIKNQ